jgi:hypothetical protein
LFVTVYEGAMGVGFESVLVQICGRLKISQAKQYLGTKMQHYKQARQIHLDTKKIELNEILDTQFHRSNRDIFTL